jgi:hypothetical protein
MAENSFKINKSATLTPQPSVPVNPTDGDIYYDANFNTVVSYNNGEWVNVASRADVPSATDMTSSAFTAAIVQNPFVRITGSTIANLDGMAASTGGKQVLIYNQSSAITTIKYQSSTETNPVNRIITMTGIDVPLNPGAMAMFAYDDVQQRWIADTFVSTQETVQAYPSQFVTDEASLSAAISLCVTGGGGVICLLNAFPISSAHTIPPDTVLIGRKGLSVVTVLSGGSLTISNYAEVKDVYLTTALSSGTLMTLGSTRSTVEGCKFIVPGSSTVVCIYVTGNYNLILACDFLGVLAPSTGVGIEFVSGTGNVKRDCLFES